MKNLLVAVDLADENMLLLEKAVELSYALGATLHILHVTFLPFVSGDDGTVQAKLREMRRQLEDTVQHIAKALPVNIHLENRGRVHDAVHRLAAQLETDLIIAGHSSRPPEMPQSLLTTSEFIAVHARRPVLLVGQKSLASYQNALIDFRDTKKPLYHLQHIAPILKSINCTFVFLEASYGLNEGVVTRLLHKLRRFQRSRLQKKLQKLLNSGLHNDKPTAAAFLETDESQSAMSLVRKSPDLVVKALQGGSFTYPVFSQKIRMLMQKQDADFLLVQLQ